ncbi:MAG: DNA mismatch repair protein MutS, partial [Aquificaceae bacterium]
MLNEDLTPMLSQYHHFKRLYPDCLLFFRLGDFYELFYEDATIGSKELGIVLTSRPTGKGRERISMCGVPYHSSSSYISKLISRGYKVAICEQIEDPNQAKGLVKRDVVRVITPGTYFEKDISGLACAYKKGNTYFCAYLNLTTGEFLGGSFNEYQSYEFLAKFSPKELILPRGLEYKFDKFTASFKTEVDENCFSDGLEELKKDFGIYNSRALGFDKEEQLLPCGCIYTYVKRTQKSFLPFLNKPKPYADEGYVRIDYKVRRGLELIESWEGREELSLFGVIDRTLTPMGRRKLKFYILHPFSNKEKIEQLQSAVEELKNKVSVLYEIRKHLDQIPDMEKLISKISGNLAKPKDFLLLKRALFSLDGLKESLKKEDLSSSLLVELTEKVEDTKDVARDIDDILVQDPPIHLKEGGLIRNGVDSRLDELRYVLEKGERLIK